MIPTPPAQILEAPVARELAFEGFNHFPLKGTVLAAEGSPWFAVLVADSGPLDRDWSEARLKTHAGKALAEWLRGQGVGSLRFDKRIAGSRDPRLDSSLDAQAGDLRAALQAARALPEAKGRKLLLVGHGEGALLGLLVGMEADALLLLAPPNQSMAKAITAQITLQLPSEKAASNLAHLQAVFQAIRDGRPAPAPGPDVYPALAKLGVSFMAPETLAYVKATLDLDPWLMASRIPIPVAMAWGGKDLLAWKPDTVPASYKGAILEVPQANHVFREEPRRRSDLNGATALEGYRDDRPLANLELIASWIKTLH